MPIGFYVSFKIDTKNYNKKILKANLLVVKKIIVAIAGPFVNFILIVVFLLFTNDRVFNIEVEALIYTNLLILVFNMIAIYPLDGGRILKNTFYLFLGKVNSLKATMIISNITAIILTVFIIIISIYFKNILYIFVLVYIWIIVIKENKTFKLKIKMYKILKNYIAINED